MKPANYLIEVDNQLIEYWRADILRIDIKEYKQEQNKIYKRTAMVDGVRFRYVLISMEDLKKEL